MNDWLEIYTLGGLVILRNGVPVKGFEVRKEEALLVYLAYTGQPQPREVLAELLWDERPQSQSLANLRALLAGLRRRVDSYLVTTRYNVALNPDKTCWLDTASLERNLADADGRRLQNEMLEPALALYRGDFLAGFHVRDSKAFEAWATTQRERLLSRITQSLYDLIRQDLDQGRYIAGIAHATRLLELDPLQEEAYRHLMLLLAQSGQRAAALAQYERCRRVLAEGLGVEPTEDTITTYRAIQASKIRTAPAALQANPRNSQQPHGNLPPQPTPFVGRETELRQIADYLRNPSCRLLTITGPGGIGKTRVALQAARELDRSANSVYCL